MGTSSWNLSRIGSANNTGDERALNLKVFSGEILTAWTNATKMIDKHRVRSISNAKSAQFLVTGTTSADYHVPGTTIDGEAAKVNELVIEVDAELVSAVAIPNIDEALASADLRKPLSDQLGIALATQFDTVVALNGLKAARITTPRITGEANMVGAQIDVTDDASGLRGGFFAAAENFDVKNVPAEMRNAFLRPAQYYKLVQDSDLGNRDFGSISDFGSGTVKELAGIGIYKSNNMPNSNVTGTYQNKYDVDASLTKALIMTPDAVGTVKVADIAFNTTGEEYFTTHRATLLTAAQLMGHGTLRPECAVELKLAG